MSTKQGPRRIACSWSGGKDSALALELAVEHGALATALLTMLDESGRRSRSHGLPLAVLEAQARALHIPLVTRAVSWADYTLAFTDALAELAERGCTHCVFGDIDNDRHRDWCKQVCRAAGLRADHPLWRRDRRELAEALFSRKFAAQIVVVREGTLDASLLGRLFDRELIEELATSGVDLCGENGEFHTVVTNGPCFDESLHLRHVSRYATAGCVGLLVELTASEGRVT